MILEKWPLTKLASRRKHHVLKMGIQDGDPRWGSGTKAKQKNQFVTDYITSTSRRPDLMILFKRTKINRNEDKQVMLSYQWGVVASIDNVNSYIATAVIPCCRTE